MKLKTIKSRKTNRSAKSAGGKNSLYAQKIAQQKRGKFSKNSPYKLVETEGEAGIGLQEFNTLRFRTPKH